MEVKFDLEISIIQLMISRYSYVSVLNEVFVLAVESDTDVFYSLEMAFTFHLTVKVRYVDQTTFISAIQTAWTTKRSGQYLNSNSAI